MEKTLDELVINESGIVKKITAQGRIKQRLFDMGITPNAPVMYKKASPLGDPIEISIRGYALSLRKEEAKCIIVEVKNA